MKSILPLLCLTSLVACATTPSDRDPASAPDRPALDGLRVNSGRSTSPDQWSVRLHDGNGNHWKKDSAHLKTFDLSSSDSRADFVAHLSELQKNDDITKKAKPALAEALRFLSVLDASTSTYRDRREAFAALSEVISAFNHFFASDAPYKTWVGALPLRALDLLGFPIMTDPNPPRSTDVVAGSDDPIASAFWQPRAPRDEDYFYGAGRSSTPDLTKKTCAYGSAKKSGGTHGGFKIMCDGSEWKIKFGNETKTEPFASRLAYTLGYNVHIVDVLPELNLPYDRRVIQDYNSREPIKFTITSGIGPNFVSRDVQKVYNPFVDAIQGAALNDGSYVAAAELQLKLVPASGAKDFNWKDIDDSKFDIAFEKTIKSLSLREGSVEPPRPDVSDIGTWSWNELNHENRRDLRGFGILAAYVGNFDIRTDNNAVSVRTDDQGGRHLEFAVSDLGAGLGSAKYLLTEDGGEANVYPWTLVTTRPDRVGGGPNERGVTPQSPYVFSTYNTMLSTKPFSEITADDARWMIRKLAAINENQLLALLIGSSHQAAETRLLLEKLVERRKQLIHAFELDQEFPQLMSRQVNRRLNYNPRHDAVPQTQIGSQIMRADVGRQKILGGKLVDY